MQKKFSFKHVNSFSLYIPPAMLYFNSHANKTSLKDERQRDRVREGVTACAPYRIALCFLLAPLQ